ncbi:MAG: endonuclease/exonuclease/phosphatase family protein [Bacteroidales bacterium]|nr:endonuclease/exonuclease/phosphatase family protein [Bacteroidales bacterium]
MRRFFTLTACLFVAISVSGQGLDLKVCSYNLWTDHARESTIKKGTAHPDRCWSKSKHAMGELIADIDADIYGVQECMQVIREELPKEVKKAGKKDLEWWFCLSYPNSSWGANSPGNGIAFNKNRFKISDKRVFWLSETPYEESGGWDAPKEHRTVMVCTVTEKASGKQFVFMATHTALKPEANKKNADVLIWVEQTYNKKNLPCILVGDMNANPKSPFSGIVRTWWQDSYNLWQGDKPEVRRGTFNSSGGKEPEKITNCIDFVYVKTPDEDGCEVSSYDVRYDRYNIGTIYTYPSDHCPVVTEMHLK